MKEVFMMSAENRNALVDILANLAKVVLDIIDDRREKAKLTDGN